MDVFTLLQMRSKIEELEGLNVKKGVFCALACGCGHFVSVGVR